MSGCCMWWCCVFILHTYSWGIRIVVLLCVSVFCWVAILLLHYCISCWIVIGRVSIYTLYTPWTDYIYRIYSLPLPFANSLSYPLSLHLFPYSSVLSLSLAITLSQDLSQYFSLTASLSSYVSSHSHSNPIVVFLSRPVSRCLSRSLSSYISGVHSHSYSTVFATYSLGKYETEIYLCRKLPAIEYTPWSVVIG